MTVSPGDYKILSDETGTKRRDGVRGCHFPAPSASLFETWQDPEPFGENSSIVLSFPTGAQRVG